MLFNSYIFILVFLPLTLILYFGLHHFGRKKQAQAALVLLSLWFYGYLNPSFIPVIIASILINFGVSRLVLPERREEKVRKAILAGGIVLNVAALFYVKYFSFVVQNLNVLFRKNFELGNILLPLGISFFTFQQIAYLVDSYRGETADITFLEYAVFVTYFPKLVEGPIVLHGEIIPQLRAEKNDKPDSYNLSRGLHIFAVGLFKKMLLADTFGTMVTLGFGGVDILSSMDVLLVMFAYTFQLYFDFSGYCDMAVGISCMLNIHLPINFNSPYKAMSILEFWDRWHITLTRFLRNYLYFPLGGSRKGKVRTYVNVMIVFLVSGLWHGANWTFVVWGALHGIAEVLTRIFKGTWEKLHPAFQWMATFLFVSAAWLIFRADSLGQALILFRKLISVESLTITPMILEGLTIPEIAHLEKLLHLDGLIAKISGFHVWAMFGIALFVVLNTRNCYEKEFRCNIRTALATVVMLVWPVISLTGVSTFLYANF